MQIWDSHERYGVISRPVHWGMAALMLWQFSGMLSKITLGKDSALTKALSGNHTEIGTLLLILIVFRIVWAFLNRNNRPPHEKGLAGLAAKAGHLALYALMALVPVTAVIRAWGGEWGYSPFGIQIFAGREPDQVITTATAIGSNFHGELAWIMGALILGHIFMALAHHLLARDGTLKRMAG